MTSDGEVSSSQIGWALSLQTLSSVFFALQFGRLKRRFSFQAILAIIFLAYGINHFTVAMTPNYVIVVIGLLIGGIGVGLNPPTNSGWLASVTPPSLRGKAVGGLPSALFLGQFFSPIFAQPIIDHFGLDGLFLLAAIGALGIAAIFAVVAVRLQKAGHISVLSSEEG